MERKTPLIFTQISAVMSDIGHISKKNKNAQQNYLFRGIDDVYNELHDLMAKHQIFTIPEVLEERTEEKQSSRGSTLLYRILKIKYTFYAEDGSNVSAVVIGEGMDSGDKASNKAMAVAHKYALTQTFCIPTEEPKDPEYDSPQIGKPAADYTERYTGTEVQKRRLMLIFEKEGLLTKSGLMKAIHDQLVKDRVEIGSLEKEVKNFLDKEMLNEIDQL